MEVFVPDQTKETEALARTTHLAVAAHQDDIEFMAYHGILECFGRNDRWFTGVVVTNGSGSPRSGVYAGITDEEMMAVRAREQRVAAEIGGYSAQVMMDYSSGQTKDPEDRTIVEELKELLVKTQPEIVYMHNPADKHPTHLGTVVKMICALRESGIQPKAVYGCEVWRDLDWMCDREKVRLALDGRPHLENALMGVFDSQIAGGKRYDLAVSGRRYANATFAEAHGVDEASSVNFAMDLTPLVRDHSLDVLEFVTGYIDRFKTEVTDALRRLL